jgi:hypothetical protein
VTFLNVGKDDTMIRDSKEKRMQENQQTKKVKCAHLYCVRCHFYQREHRGLHKRHKICCGKPMVKHG